MAPVLRFEDLLAIARTVGIALEEAPPEDANLYVIVDDQDVDLYVGKAASVRRHAEEKRFSNLDHTREILSGFVALWRENSARSRGLSYDPAAFDPTAALAIIAREGWGGGACDGLGERHRIAQAPTVEEVEKVLVRIHIRAGRLIGNSQFGSQWESPIGSYTDTLAALAVDAARTAGILPTLSPLPPPSGEPAGPAVPVVPPVPTDGRQEAGERSPSLGL
ncbi:hypothetical protein ACXET9_15370 [Brachybacterium sp. DNPG3]